MQADTPAPWTPASRYRVGHHAHTVPSTVSVAFEESVGYSSIVMIWIGRIVSIPLGVVFFVLLVLTLVLLRVNDTFLNPGFYPRQLAEADLYRFALEDVLASALDEARELDPADFSNQLSDEIDENPLVTSGLSTERIVLAVNRAVPPEYVQGLVEQSFDELGRYATGERDEFALTVRAGEQVATMVDEVKALLREANAYELLFETELKPRVREAVDVKLPLGVEVPSNRLVAAVERIAPPEWVQEQVEAALDEVTPYFVGEKDSFEIRVELSDRVEIALREVKDILREIDAYELLYSEVVEPEIVKILGDAVDLPFGLSVTNEEVVTSLREVAPPEWVQDQVERVIDDVSPYLTGKTDGFSTEVSLVENKQLASRIIADLVDLKLIQAIDELPTCLTATEVLSAARVVTGALPSCVPEGISVRELIDRTGIDIADAIQSFVLGPIPNQVRFTDAQVRSALRLAGAGDNLESVDQVREVLRDGWTYTDADLKEDLRELDGGDENVETLNDVRSFLADGWTYTHLDLREDLAGQEVDSGLSNVRTADDMVERIRGWFKTSRQFRWLVYVPLLLLLVVIGFLGGRGWAGRVVWGASFLLGSSAIVFLVAGPVYGVTAGSGFDEARERALAEIDANPDADFFNTSRLAAEKGLDVAESVGDEFVAGIQTASLTLAIIALVVILAAVFWGAITTTLGRQLRSRRE